MSTAPPAFIGAADHGMDPARTDSINTTSLNNAIAAAQAQGGGVVVIPPGTYTITGTINIAASGITLQGANQHATVLQFDNGSSDCLVVGGQPSSVYGVLISQMTLKGEGKTGGDLLHASNISNMTVRDVTMSDGYNGFYHEISNNVLLNNVNINLSQPGGSYGIKWYSAAEESTPSHVTTLDSVIVNCNLTGADGMIIDGYCHTLRVKCMGILRSNHGLCIRNTQNSDSYFPQFMFCDDLEIDGVQTQALRIEAGRQFHFNNSDFFNNCSEGGSDTDCVHITADSTASVTSALWFTSCRIAAAQHRGIYSEATNLTLASCYIGSNSLAGAGSYPGIELGGTSVGNRFTGCLIGANFGDVPSQSYGVVAHPDVRRVSIIGCDFAHCIIGAILDNTDFPGNIAWRGCFDINGAPLPDNMAILPRDPSDPPEGALWENLRRADVKVQINGTIRTISIS